MRISAWSSYVCSSDLIAGEDLFTDTAWLGPRDAKAVLVTVSGTHGIEGYYGSGCQTGWLADGHAAKLPAGTAMLMIHASNPYGFSWGDRKSTRLNSSH